MENKTKDEVKIEEVTYINPTGFDEVIPTGKETVTIEPPVEGQNIRVEIREEIAQAVKDELSQLESSLMSKLKLKGEEVNVTSEK